MDQVLCNVDPRFISDTPSDLLDKNSTFTDVKGKILASLYIVF